MRMSVEDMPKSIREEREKLYGRKVLNSHIWCVEHARSMNVFR